MVVAVFSREWGPFVMVTGKNNNNFQMKKKHPPSLKKKKEKKKATNKKYPLLQTFFMGVTSSYNYKRIYEVKRMNRNVNDRT